VTDPTAGPDEPHDDDTHPDDQLTVEKILAAAGAPEALAALPAGESQADKLIALALLHYRLVAGDDGRPYAVPVDGPALAIGLRGRAGLRGQLARLYYDTHRQAPGGTGLTDAMTVLEAQAERAEPAPIGLRVARTGDGQSIAIDLGAPDGQAVIVGSGGWRLVDRSPVLFRRSALTGALPTPLRGGSLDGLRALLNVDDARFRLLVAWLLAALVPDIPHPILALFGEQGTAKSTCARLLVDLVDPSPAPLRTPPRELRSWAAAAHASWIIALDNLSAIPPWFSDTLCKAVTGDGVVERALHTDDDLNILTFRRVVAMTSIDAGALAGDLAERLLPVELDPIPPEGRRSDAEIAALHDQARPAVFGALLDLLAQTLTALPTVELAELPRMADFARLLAALDATQGWDTRADYTAGAAETALAVLDYDPVAVAIRDAIGRAGAWHGTASALLDKLTPDQPPKTWPRNPRALAGALKRLAPALRLGWGITVTWPPRGQVRTLTIRGPEAPDQAELANG